MNKTLSVCIIALNEEATIQDCLESVKFADEIIVIDTGSTDKTKEIASKYTQNIHDFKWTGSYSDARNYAKSFATKDWILSIDCDERLSDETHLKKLINDERCDAWALIQSVTEEDGSLSICNTHRLFKNLPVITWANRIHEIIDISLLKNSLKIGKSQLQLKHLPKDKALLENKFKGYIEQLKIDYDNPLRYYYLGLCFTTLGEFEKGLIYLYQCLNDKYTKGLQALVCMFVSDFFVQNDDLWKAIEYQDAGIRICPKQYRGYVALAGLYYSIGEYDKALKNLNQVQNNQSLNTELVNDVNYSQQYLQDLEKLILDEKQNISKIN